MTKTKRCYSKCRQLSADNCKAKSRLCQYTHGSRKYCRLSKSYYLNDKCEMIKKKVKLTKEEAVKKIGRFILSNKKTIKKNKTTQKKQYTKPKNTPYTKKMQMFLNRSTKNVLIVKKSWDKGSTMWTIYGPDGIRIYQRKNYANYDELMDDMDPYTTNEYTIVAN